MISGFFFFSRLDRHAVSKRIPYITRRLLVPLVLWTYLFLFVRWVFSDFTNAQPGSSSLLVLPFPGILHFWFLWALWLAQVALMILTLAIGQWVRPGMLWSVSLALAVSVWVLAPTLPFGIQLGAAYEYAVFFVLGRVVFKCVDPLRTDGIRILAATAVFGVLVWLAIGAPASRVVNLLVAVGLSVSFIVIAKWLSGIGGFGVRMFQWMGAFSFSIYMMHTIFSAGIRAMLFAAGIQSLGVHLIAAVAAGIAFPIAFSLMVAQYRFSGVLGLEDRAPVSR
jgi:Acyltransferase family